MAFLPSPLCVCVCVYVLRKIPDCHTEHLHFSPCSGFDSGEYSGYTIVCVLRHRSHRVPATTSIKYIHMNNEGTCNYIYTVESKCNDLHKGIKRNSSGVMLHIIILLCFIQGKKSWMQLLHKM